MVGELIFTRRCADPLLKGFPLWAATNVLMIVHVHRNRFGRIIKFSSIHPREKVLVSVPICHSLMMEDGFVKMAAVREKGYVCSESCAGKRGSFVCRGALQSRAQLFKTNDVVS